MKIKKVIKTYCPFCRKHTPHKVKEAKKGKRRSMSKGQARHLRKTKGYTSKIAGKANVKKQSKKTKLMLTCEQCKKQHEKLFPKRTKKKIEIKNE